jgi:hypothetical protein
MDGRWDALLQQDYTERDPMELEPKDQNDDKGMDLGYSHGVTHRDAMHKEAKFEIAFQNLELLQEWNAVKLTVTARRASVFTVAATILPEIKARPRAL